MQEAANPGRTRMSNIQNTATELITKNVIQEAFPEIRYHLPTDFQHKCQSHLTERGQSFLTNGNEAIGDSARPWGQERS